MALGITLEKQKDIASNLLSAFRLIDPFAMVAGGAPRDWYFNRLANDLDIYVRLPNHNTIGLVENLAKMLGITKFHVLAKTTDTSYAELPNLKWVFEGYYDGEKVNIMVMEKGVGEEIIKDFDVAICKTWFDGIQSHYHDEFEFCIKTRVCVVHERYTGKEAHVQRMAQRFPQFMFYKKLEIAEPEPDVSFDYGIPEDLPSYAPSAPSLPSRTKTPLSKRADLGYDEI